MKPMTLVYFRSDQHHSAGVIPSHKAIYLDEHRLEEAESHDQPYVLNGTPIPLNEIIVLERDYYH